MTDACPGDEAEQNEKGHQSDPKPFEHRSSHAIAQTGRLCGNSISRFIGGGN